MERFHAAVLGIVQGLTEFLPVSSSAHLVAVPWLLGWPDPGLAFDAALHLGTLAAAFGYYRKEWGRAFEEAFHDPRSRGGRLLACLALGTIPGGLAGLLLERRLAPLSRLPPVFGVNLIVFGLLLGLASRVGSRFRSLETVTFRDAAWIGTCQAFALLPGVSRSGITMTAALFLGLDYEAAAAFSFLLSVPITAAAALHELVKLSPALLRGPFWVGLAFSAASGVLAIRLLLGAMGRWGVRPFVAYRIAAGLGFLALWRARLP